MEAIGHYWQNLFAALVAKRFAVALVHSLRAGLLGRNWRGPKPIALTVYRSPFWRAEASCSKPAARVGGGGTARADAVAGALDARVSRPPQSAASRGGPGFSRVHALSQGPYTALATAILRQYPTARALRGVSRKRAAKLSYDGCHQVGAELAQQLMMRRRNLGRQSA